MRVKDLDPSKVPRSGSAQSGHGQMRQSVGDKASLFLDIIFPLPCSLDFVAFVRIGGTTG